MAGVKRNIQEMYNNSNGNGPAPTNTTTNTTTSDQLSSSESSSSVPTTNGNNNNNNNSNGNLMSQSSSSGNNNNNNSNSMNIDLTSNNSNGGSQQSNSGGSGSSTTNGGSANANTNTNSTTTNGGSASGGGSGDAANSNEAKKTRLDTQSGKQEPSRVVHLRNIPHQLTENEIIFLGLSFGMIKNVLFLRSKNQAFLEFDVMQEAQQMILHFGQSSTTFSGKKIFVQYSNHQELNTDPSNSNNLVAQAALAEAVQLHKSAKQGGKNTVLRATILNMIYPVTLDVLHQIFSKFGNVLKVITFNKNDKFQVLIQIKDPMAAQNAKLSLHGQNIYNGCCTLQIDFSKLTTLEVRYNNDKSRDYTNLLLPTGDGQTQSTNINTSMSNLSAGGNNNTSNNNNNGSDLEGNNGGRMQSSQSQQNIKLENSSGGGGAQQQQQQHQQQQNSSHHSQLSAMQYQQGLIGTPPSMYGGNNNNNNNNSSNNNNQNSNSNNNNSNNNNDGGNRGANNGGGSNNLFGGGGSMQGGMHNQMGGNGFQLGGGGNGQNQMGGGLGGSNQMGGGGVVGSNQNLMGGVNQMGQQQQMQGGGNQMNNQNNNNNNGSVIGGQGGSMSTPVLLVSNLNEEFVTPEALFTLFGVYGDVLRVKILFNKKDSALINFSNGQQANTALGNLDRCKLWSKQIRVFPSKHLTVQMPKDGQPDSGLTKDFSNSPLHRFKKPGSKNFNNIFPPSQTLHLSNIPPNVSEQELRDLFGMYGTVKGFKFFQKDRKMALLQMDAPEEAITALIATHNYQLADNMHLRCTFSKATI